MTRFCFLSENNAAPKSPNAQTKNNNPPGPMDAINGMIIIQPSAAPHKSKKYNCLIWLENELKTLVNIKPEKKMEGIVEDMLSGKMWFTVRIIIDFVPRRFIIQLKLQK